MVMGTRLILRKRSQNPLGVAVLAPMPRANVSTATAVKPGFFSNWRRANLRSFIVRDVGFGLFTAERFDRIDRGRAFRREPTADDRREGEHAWNHREC